MNVIGTLIQNHNETNTQNVPNGMALELPSCHTTRFMRKKSINTTPGNRNDVQSVNFCHERPLRCLYVTDALYPATAPMNTNDSTNAFINEPRFDGLKKPIAASVTVTKLITNN